jgi:hypothetical protein
MALWDSLEVVLEPIRRFLRGLDAHAHQFFTNWHRYEAPVTVKLALGVRNRVRATFSREQCCGHPGQPGC